MRTIITKALGVSVVLFLVASCAGRPMPAGNIAPEKSIAAAVDQEVDDYPEARQYLELARSAVNEAEEMKAAGQVSLARYKLAEAQVDADFAIALMRREAAREEARVVKRRIQDLREDMRNALEESQ